MSNTNAVLLRTWQFDVNRLIANTSTTQPGGNDDAPAWRRELLFQIKERLKAFATLPWTVSQSNGFNSGLNLSGDNWANIDDIRWRDNRTFQRSWIVLRNNALGIEVCFDCYNANARDGIFADVFVAPIANPFGSGSVGTITARPTATLELQILNGDSEAWGGGTETPSTPDTFVLHIMHSTDGLATRVIALSNRQPILFWQFDPVVNTIGSLSHPWIARVKSTGTGNVNTVTYAHLVQNANTPMLSNIDTEVQTYMAGVSNDTFPTQTFWGQTALVKNPYDGRVPLSPIAIASESVGFTGMFGEIADLWISTAGFTGKGYPESTSNLMQFGDYVFPWNGSNPLL